MLHRLSIIHSELTTQIGVDENGVICEASPAFGRFLGLPMERLFAWLHGLGPGLEVTELP
jgi:hypothetical protein